MNKREVLTCLMSLVDNHTDKLVDQDYVSICTYLKSEFQKTKQDCDIIASCICSIEPPVGKACNDLYGNRIHVGDKVRCVGDLSEFVNVIKICYWGFENRDDSLTWDEPGFVVKTSDNEYLIATNIVKIQQI